MKSIKKTSIIFGIFSFVALLVFAKQEKVLQIFRNGEIIQEYSVDDIDYIEVNDLIQVPTGVNATVTNDQITIKWNPVEGATYNIYRSSDNVNFALLASKLTETTYTDTNPNRGSNFYRIKAVVGDVESGYTSSVAASLANSELESGIYLGITGFNQTIYDYPILPLTENSVDGFLNFIDDLPMKNGTLLYYSVDQALNTMQSTELPSDIDTAAIVIFTDGLDQGSMMKDVPYDDDMAYLDALNNRIKNETVSGQPITAFSIGIRGKDVGDIAMFRANLAKLASSPENATEVTSMSEVNAKFQEIAAGLSQSNYIQTINLKIPGLSNGTLVRFTFDNVSSAERSTLYIQGTFNLKERSLENVEYVGLTSTSGTTIKGTVDDIFVTFKFEGVHTDNNTLIKSVFTDEWTYIASNSSWQINSEFDKTENTDIITERSSAVIILVLDCSNSLASDFVTAQNNAKNFITTLCTAEGGAISGNPADQVFTVNGVSFTMKFVEGGSFEMGATAEQYNDYTPNSDESPVHLVTLSDYYIGQTEVTQELWQAVMGASPTSSRSWESDYGLGAKYPAYFISYTDCQQFIYKLNSLTGQQFRMPTEAEWEYAARGGSKSGGYVFSGSNTIDEVGWYASNSGGKTHEVATKAPNELGIYDMSGNVYEWCSDWYGSYSSGSQTNPTGPSTGSYRVVRGGSCRGSDATYCRVSYRYGSSPGDSYINLGLRLAL